MCSSRYLIVHLECSSHCVYGHMRDVEQRSAFQVYGPRYDSFRVLYRSYCKFIRRYVSYVLERLK